MAASNDLGQWYRSIPPITRTWFTSSIIITGAAALNLVHSYRFLLSINLVIKHFEIWRLLTAVLYHPIFYPYGLTYLINLYFIYTYSSRLETSTFIGKPADYVFCLIFLWICNIIAGWFLSMPILMISMVMSIIYIWCQLNKEVTMSFWFGTQFKAMYMPWVIALFHWIMAGSIREYLCGIIIGHLYYFIVFKYPKDFGGRQLIHTPRFLYRYFPNERNGFSTGGFSTEPINRRHSDDDTNRGSQVFGGRGHVLGTR